MIQCVYVFAGGVILTLTWCPKVTPQVSTDKGSRIQSTDWCMKVTHPPPQLASYENSSKRKLHSLIVYRHRLNLYKHSYCCSVLYVDISVALLKAQVSLQLGKVFSSDNGVSVSIMYSYMY